VTGERFFASSNDLVGCLRAVGAGGGLAEQCGIE
jgi:hypothetical protein